jgi:glycosyltransferase involved in cell wall biosynthesis
MKNSLIIITYNKSIWLELVLNSLIYLNNSYIFEVVIVDDGSKDNTRDVAESFYSKVDINYIYQKNGGISAARNTAIKAAKGELLIFIDDDRIVTKDYLKEHIESHLNISDDKMMVVGNRHQLYVSNLEAKKSELLDDISKNLVYYKRLSRIDAYNKVTNKLFTDGKTASPIQWISCIFANLSIKNCAFKEAGLFDENFKGWGCEDIEMGHRLYDKGYNVYLNENAVNYHLEHSRSSEIPKEFINNFNYMYSKHTSLDVELYLDFEQGRLSLENYTKSVAENKIVNDMDNGTYYMDKNIFRRDGMK